MAETDSSLKTIRSHFSVTIIRKIRAEIGTFRCNNGKLLQCYGVEENPTVIDTPRADVKRPHFPDTVLIILYSSWSTSISSQEDSHSLWGRWVWAIF